MASIKDVFMTIGPQGPVSPLLAKYYGLPYNQNLWQGNSFGFTGSTNPARAPYQFNMPMFGYSNVTPRGEGFRPPPAPLAPPAPPAPPGPPEFEDEGGGGDTGGDSSGSETPEDAATPGNYDFDWGDVAKGALGVAGALASPLGFGTIGNVATIAKGVNAISDVFGSPRDDTPAAQAAADDIAAAMAAGPGTVGYDDFEEEQTGGFGKHAGVMDYSVADLDDALDVAVDVPENIENIGPQVDPDGLKGLGIPGVTVDSTNLDAVGFPELEEPSTTVEEALGLNDDTAAAEEATGSSFSEMSDRDDIEDVAGGIGSQGMGPDPNNDPSSGTDSNADSDTGSPGSSSSSANSDTVSDDTGGDDAGDCYVSTALADTGVWSASEKRKAVMWCRRTHHDGSGRGRVWVDGYHGWGLLTAKAARRFPLFRRIVRASTDAFMRLESGEPNPLGYIIKYGWIQPLSYGVGLVKWIVKGHRDAH